MDLAYPAWFMWCASSLLDVRQESLADLVSCEVLTM
jgi:hypothetical protein